MAVPPVSSGSNATGTNKFAELSSESFVRIMTAELTSQDPLKPNDSSHILEQMSSLRQIESSTTLTNKLDSLVSQNEFSAASSLLGAAVSGISENGSRQSGIAVSIVRTKEGGSLVLDNGYRIAVRNIDTVDVPFLDEDPTTPPPTNPNRPVAAPGTSPFVPPATTVATDEQQVGPTAEGGGVGVQSAHTLTSMLRNLLGTQAAASSSSAAPSLAVGGGGLNFASLLASARNGQITSGRPVEAAPEVKGQLTTEQLSRLAVAVDHAESAGMSSAAGPDRRQGRQGRCPLPRSHRGHGPSHRRDHRHRRRARGSALVARRQVAGGNATTATPLRSRVSLSSSSSRASAAAAPQPRSSLPLFRTQPPSSADHAPSGVSHMASTVAMYTGLSGLNANARNLDVIGNNIANVNTTAYKSNRLLFQNQFSRNFSMGTSPAQHRRFEPHADRPRRSRRRHAATSTPVRSRRRATPSTSPSPARASSWSTAASAASTPVRATSRSTPIRRSSPAAATVSWAGALTRISRSAHQPRSSDYSSRTDAHRSGVHVRGPHRQPPRR